MLGRAVIASRELEKARLSAPRFVLIIKGLIVWLLAKTSSKMFRLRMAMWVLRHGDGHQETRSETCIGVILSFVETCTTSVSLVAAGALCGDKSSFDSILASCNVVEQNRWL